MRRIETLLAASAVLLSACGHDDHCADGHVDAECPGTTTTLAHTLFVAHEGSLVSYDVETGAERPGAVQDVGGPVDLQALADGTVIVNLTNNGEILVVDGKTMLETANLGSSAIGGQRPVHGFVSPERGGRRFWMALNDGMGSVKSTNSAVFVDIAAGSATRFQRAGEVALGIGHHKASFSSTTDRVVISNISDCDDVISVFDYSNLGAIRSLATLTSSKAGWRAADPGAGMFDPRFCDPTYARGLPPAPHGCATSKASGKAYCNLTGSGEMVVVDVDAATPTFTMVPTAGKGGGFTLAHPAGRYLYTMQEEPREGKGGAACQVGQVVVTDAMTDTVVAQVALRYEGPSCTRALTGTPAESANPGHSHFLHDGNKLLVPSSGGFGVTTARVDQLMVLDTSNPAMPVQLASVKVGVHTDHSASALSGDGKLLFVTNTVDGSVSVVDTATLVARTITTKANPKTIASFGTVEGPNDATGPVSR